MRLLFLTPQLPYPPRQGATLRNFNLIRELARNHSVDLITLLAPGESLAADNRLHTLCGRIAAIPQPVRTRTQRALETLASPLPDMARRLDTPALHTTLRAWLRDVGAEPYAVIQFEGIEMTPYLATAQAILRENAASSPAPALVFDNHNCEYLLQKRNALNDLRVPSRIVAGIYSTIQWWKLRRYERQVCLLADATLAVSGPDAAALAALTQNRAAIHVIPNGITPNGIQTEEHAAEQFAQPGAEQAGNTSHKPITLVFTGKMDYRPNVDAVLWFAHHVLPRLLDDYPQLRFQIVGMNPHPRVAALRHAPEIAPHIEVTGSVEDIQPYIQDATVFVIPLRVGGGTRFKVLEALIAGRPTVSTALGVEGIGVVHGEHLLIADTPVDFATAVTRLLEDQRAQGGNLCRALGHKARNFVAQNYAWSSIAPQLDTVYQGLRAGRVSS